MLLPVTAVAAPQDEEDTVFEDATEESAGTPASAEKSGGKRTVLDDIVVTATRSEERVREIPAKVEVLDSHDIETTVGHTLTEQLKKGASISVMEYPGALAGIGIRGFRPETDGITKHSLTLLNGRPVGATNLATVLADNIERIEVLKGPASSLYGAEAMGGVVNIITKHTTGTPTGALQVGGGSFDTLWQKANVGGTLFGPVDFDLNARNFKQDDDLTMGNGQKRHNTSYSTRNASLRIGTDIGEDWRFDVSGNGYQGRDIQTPGDIRYGDEQSKYKDIDNYGVDAKISGKLFENDKLSLSAYHTLEKAKNYEKYEGTVGSTTNPRRLIPPYNYYDSEITWDGVQLQNIYNWGDHSIIVGGDWQVIETETKRWNQAGERTKPSSPNQERTNWAAYAETVWKFLDKHLILTAGGRYDYFDVDLVDTPYFTDFTPRSASFSTFSPRVGATYLTDNGLRFHTTLGQAFVPPTAQQLANDSWSYGTSRDRHLVGNPDLDPEKSTTWDAGIGFERKGWGLTFDVTYFHTSVKDRITDVTTQVGRVQTVNYVNSDDSKIQGLETSISLDFGAMFNWGRSVRLYFNSTNYFKAEETEGGVTEDIHNVAKYTYNYGIAYEDNNFDAKLHCRSVGRMFDTDWITTSPTYGDVLEYPTFTVVDLVFSWSFLEHHKLTFTVDNIFNEDYFEKIGYPKPGRSFFLNYAYNF